jgi:hypothetical protein
MPCQTTKRSTGTYKLMTKDGEEVKNMWNISQLRRFYA